MNDQAPVGLKVIIVNWRRPADTIECVQSVLNSGIPEDMLLVVDNGSKDDSLEQIRHEFRKIELLQLPENLGFAGGYNIGIQTALKSGATKLFLLNNDTVVDQNTIPLLLASDYDICVPKIYFQNPPQMIWSAGATWRRFPPMVRMRGYQKYDSPLYSGTLELDYATACALMVKRKVFEFVGRFDEQYINYFEDYDFIYRVRQAGFHVWYIPEAKVWHKVAQSLGSESPQRSRYLGRNSVLFYRKNKRFPVWMYLGFFTWVSLRELVKLNFRHIREFWLGVREGMDWLEHGTSSM